MTRWECYLGGLSIVNGCCWKSSTGGVASDLIKCGSANFGCRNAVLCRSRFVNRDLLSTVVKTNNFAAFCTYTYGRVDTF